MTNALFFDRDDMRELSRIVFGQDHKLAVLLVFSRASRSLTLGDLTTMIGARSPSSLQRPVQDLLAAKMLAVEPTAPTDRARRYVRRESSVWGLAEELYQQLDLQEALPFG